MRTRSILQNREELKEAIEKTESISDALKFLGLRSAGGNFKAFHNACKEFGLKPKIGKSNINHARGYIMIPWEDIFKENSLYTNRDLIKKKLYQNNILEEKCNECKIGSEWNGKPLTLQLDHINGIYNDHRIENLQILCPNCHTQTQSYAGRNLEKKLKDKEEKERNKIGRSHLRKFNPTKEELEKILKTTNFVQAGKIFGVSDNAVRKRAKLYNLI